MKKRLLALFVCCVFVLSLAACAPKKSAEGPAATETVADPAATDPATATDAPDDPTPSSPTEELPDEVQPRPQPEVGEEVEFCLKVVHGDGVSMTTYVTTDKTMLGAALSENNLIRGRLGAYGLFVTTVDDERADESKEQWWCLTKDGQSVNTGVDYTPVEDGATYEFTLTTGY